MYRLKVIEFNIKGRDCDFPGMIGETAAYCIRNQIERKLAGRIQLAFEEVTQLLIAELDDQYIQAACEYSEKTGIAEWTFLYNGPQLDVMTSGNDLALSVLKGVTEHAAYNCLEGSDYPNQLKLTIRAS